MGYAIYKYFDRVSIFGKNNANGGEPLKRRFLPENINLRNRLRICPIFLIFDDAGSLSWPVLKRSTNLNL
jgi:hypothetical protein